VCNVASHTRFAGQIALESRIDLHALLVRDVLEVFHLRQKQIGDAAVFVE